MNKPQNHTKANIKSSIKHQQDKRAFNTMVKGYQEMADINLSLSKMYFEVESEVDTYYECIAESE